MIFPFLHAETLDRQTFDINNASRLSYFHRVTRGFQGLANRSSEDLQRPTCSVEPLQKMQPTAPDKALLQHGMF